MTVPILGRTRRLGGRTSGPVAAVASRFATAAGTFLLQALAARSLGAAGLGSFALVYSLILLIAAVSNGLVGDSLTVLDRTRDDIRAGLIGWCAINAVGAGAVTAAFLMLFEGTDVVGALLFVGATTCFVIESSLRRLLQANMAFWAGVVVEVVGSVASLAALGLWALFGPLDLTAFITALAIGQLAASLTAVAYLPAEDRRLPTFRNAAMGTVGAFGSWRAAQQGLRPGLLTLIRFLVVLTASREALGQLEAARVYMSPAISMVQGVGTYLFSYYAHRKNRPTQELVRQAHKAAVILGAITLVGGIIATVATPVLGHLVTGRGFSMQPAAVLGWALYASASAAVLPYQGLAAVRGRQSLVMGLRCIDAALSLVAVTALLLVFAAPASTAPYVLAAGSGLGGWLIRKYGLGPLARSEAAALSSG